MPEEWYPAATRWPGAAAGFSKGRTPVRTVTCHFTVGRDSAGIGAQGYFHWLIRRNGEVVQFCETSALAWHAGNEGNPVGPGIEVEFLPGVDDDIFTSDALSACGGLVRWLIAEWAVEPVYYDPEIRMALPLPAGFVAHRSLPNQNHTDFWPRSDWEQMVGSPQPDPEEDSMFIAVGQTVFGVPLAFLASGGRVLKTFDGPVGAYGIPQSALDWKAGPGRTSVQMIFVDPDTIGVLATPWPSVTATIPPARVDTAAIAKAVNDDAARRLSS